MAQVIFAAAPSARVIAAESRGRVLAGAQWEDRYWSGNYWWPSWQATCSPYPGLPRVDVRCLRLPSDPR